jgi:hypothetical protein
MLLERMLVFCVVHGKEKKRRKRRNEGEKSFLK